MALSLPQQRLRRALSCVFVLAVVLVSGAWLLALERVAYEESEARRQAFRETGNLALAFEQDLVGTLEALRQALFFTEHEFAQKGRGVDFASVFAMLALDHSPFTTLAIVDEHGRVLTSTGIANVDVSDREYFRFHAASPSSALHVGEPIDGRLSGRPTIPVSRRIDKLDGSFGGLVLAGVTPAYFTDFFRRIDLGRGGLIQIVGLDGVVRARQVGGVTSWGGDLLESNLAEHAGSAPSGSFVSAGRLDGVQRFMSYRRVPGAPLLISVGVPVEEAMAPFGVRRESYLRGAAAASLLVLLFAGVLALVLRRQARMAEGRRQDAERLEQVRGRLLELVDNTNDFIWETNGELALVYASSNVVKLLGYTAAQMLGKTPMEFLPPAERERVAAWFAPVLAARRPYANLVTQVMHKDGGTRFWESSAAPILDAAGALSGYRGVSRDVTERKRAEQALAESEARFRDLADNTSDFIWELDAQMRFTYASGSLKTLLGQAPESLLGHMPVEFMPPEDATRVGRAMKDLAREKKGFASLEHGVRDAEGRLHVWEVSGVPILGLDGELRGYRGVSRDITERKRAEERLEREAHYDRVTGLPNRALCFDRLSQAIVHAQRHGTFTGVLLVDLDRFKAINDTLGHATGDAVLRAAAERLGACVRAGDTVARIGGDEFAVLLQDLKEAQDAALVAKKILQALEAPVNAGDHEVFATASIGIAICPPDGSTHETLMGNADAALSQAKKAGRATFQFYTAEMNARAADQLDLERDLRRALERREFALHYQPKANLFGNRVVGFEALLRWQRRGRLVSPAQFIPVLEESGLIRQVGAWVIREACRQLREWTDAGHEPKPIAVNVSAKQFHGDLQGAIEDALRAFSVDPALLRIEITESDAMLDPERAIHVVQGLKALGIAWSIDDFGTGYSSLSYLKRFQPAELKLDRSFVNGLPGNADDVSITKAVISMAHSLGMKVVAEGVETEAQRAFLQSRGCDQMQGYLLSRPVPAPACSAFLAVRSAA